MTVSTGVILGIIGLIALMINSLWLVFNYYQKNSIKLSVIVLIASLALCVIGYIITPTGIANIRLIINKGTGIFH